MLCQLRRHDRRKFKSLLHTMLTLTLPHLSVSKVVQYIEGKIAENCKENARN